MQSTSSVVKRGRLLKDAADHYRVFISARVMKLVPFRLQSYKAMHLRFVYPPHLPLHICGLSRPTATTTLHTLHQYAHQHTCYEHSGVNGEAVRFYGMLCSTDRCRLGRRGRRRFCRAFTCTRVTASSVHCSKSDGIGHQ